MWRKCITAARRHLTLDAGTTVADVAAIGLITYGVALIYQPAAYIVAGLLVGVLSWHVSRPPIQRRDDG